MAGSSLVSELVAGKTYWSSSGAARPAARGPFVHLLPNYDELLIAYRDREALLSPSLVMDATSLIAHVVTLDGRVIGGWGRTARRDRLVVGLEPMRPLRPAGRRALDAAAEELGRFVKLPVVVTGVR